MPEADFQSHQVGEVTVGQLGHEPWQLSDTGSILNKVNRGMLMCFLWDSGNVGQLKPQRKRDSTPLRLPYQHSSPLCSGCTRSPPMSRLSAPFPLMTLHQMLFAHTTMGKVYFHMRGEGKRKHASDEWQGWHNAVAPKEERVLASPNRMHCTFPQLWQPIIC